MSISHPLPVLEQVEFFLTPAFNSDPDKFPELGRDTKKKISFYICPILVERLFKLMHYNITLYVVPTKRSHTRIRI